MRLLSFVFFISFVSLSHAEESVLYELYKRSDVIAEVEITDRQFESSSKWGGSTVVHDVMFSARVIHIFKGKAECPDLTIQFRANVLGDDKPLEGTPPIYANSCPDIQLKARIIVFLTKLYKQLRITDPYCGAIPSSRSVISDLNRYAEIKNK